MVERPRAWKLTATQLETFRLTTNWGPLLEQLKVAAASGKGLAELLGMFE